MFNVCEDCPMRLYNTKCNNLAGVGNPWYGNCIVVPNVDYKAYKNKDMAFSSQLAIIEDALSFSTGWIDSNLYVVPLIRCNESIACEVTSSIIDRCQSYLNKDIKTYSFKNILLLGSAANRFINIDHISFHRGKIYTINGIDYQISYSPLVKYTDKYFYNLFLTDVRNWYSRCVNSGVIYNINSGVY